MGSHRHEVDVLAVDALQQGGIGKPLTDVGRDVQPRIAGLLGHGVGRVLAADDRTLLLSVYSSRSDSEGVEEVAFWSDDSTFAAVLAELFRDLLADPFA